MAVGLVGVVVSGCASSTDGGVAARPGATTTATAATTTDPGALPQTMARPTTDDPVFESHLQGLWRAVVDGDPAEAMAFFFPLSAYRQVKAIADPTHDWQTRLVADFDADVLADHAALGPGADGAQFTGVAVPTNAVWVPPGSEYNKGRYWRVYGSSVRYSAGGRNGSFVIASMISWRGEWYVVHLASVR